MVNQYSFIIAGFLILVIITFLSWRFLGIKWALPLSGIVLISLVAVQQLLSTSTQTNSNVAAFESALESNEPVFLVLYSDL